MAREMVYIYCGIVFGVLAVLYSSWHTTTNLEDDARVAIIRGWHRVMSLPQRPFSKIAVGLNTNVDLITRGTDVMRTLGLHADEMKDHTVLTSLQDMEQAFHFYLAGGAAAERYFSNHDLYKKIVKAAVSQEQKQFFVGGNAALMAQTIMRDYPETKVRLVGPVGPQLRQLLSPDIEVPQDIRIESDEVHLILEFGIGEKWGNDVVKVANRFILSSDYYNRNMPHIEALFSSLTDFGPDLVILTGLHLLESLPEEMWQERVNTLEQHLISSKGTVPFHLELASMVNIKFVLALLKQIVPRVHALGLNEQELAFISTVAGGPYKYVLSASGPPDINEISDIIIWLLRNYGRSSHNPHNKLTRIHFHSLTFHIIASNSDNWQNLQSAVAAGAHIAGMQACDLSTMVSEKFELRIPKSFKLSGHPDHTHEISLNASEPVVEYKVGNISLYLSPVLVCKNPLKTVGLGDAISATALLYSSYVEE